MADPDVRLMAIAHLLGPRFAQWASVAEKDIEAAAILIDRLDPWANGAPLATVPIPATATVVLPHSISLTASASPSNVANQPSLMRPPASPDTAARGAVGQPVANTTADTGPVAIPHPASPGTPPSVPGGAVPPSPAGPQATDES